MINLHPLNEKAKLLASLIKKKKILPSKAPVNRNKNVLQPKKPLEFLNSIHNKFFNTPTDEVDGNIAFIC